MYLTRDGAQYIVDFNIKLVGIDYVSIERYGTPDFFVHHTLLGAGICILEGLDFRKVNQGSYFLSALPLKINKADGSPVRACLFEI